MKKCPRCNIVKDESEFYKNCTTKDGLETYCKDCKKEYYKIYRENNREKLNKYSREYSYQTGMITPMNENKECPKYLGCYINERILKHVMPNAVLMSNNNPGYDLVCGKGYLVDAKAATLRKFGKKFNHGWYFNIHKNKTPDYFLLTAYKDRESLEIYGMWLIPGDVINDKTGLTISLSTIHKWDQYKIDHTDALSCVTQMKASA